jgi:hypothetical protein
MLHPGTASARAIIRGSHFSEARCGGPQIQADRTDSRVNLSQASASSTGGRPKVFSGAEQSNATIPSETRLSLAIGIGANTAIFSLVNSVLLRPLAYKEPDRLFAARELLPHLFGRTSMPVNPMHAREWAKQCPSVEQVALIRNRRADIGSGGEPASVSGADVPHNLFALFGVDPILGRTFLAEEEGEGANRVVMLSESLWRSRFHADPSLVGSSILVDGQSYQVTGIVQRGSGFLSPARRTCSSSSFVLWSSPRISRHG